MRIAEFLYKPSFSEAEKASNAYVMSLVALMAGLPLPIMNLVATLIFFLANKRERFFVRWHCTQALLSQLLVLPFNSFAFWWTVSILMHTRVPDNNYVAYMITIIAINIVEFSATIYAAIKTRNRTHVEWYFVGPLTHLICKPDTNE